MKHKSDRSSNAESRPQTRRRKGGQELPDSVQDRPEQNAGYDAAVRGGGSAEAEDVNWDGDAGESAPGTRPPSHRKTTQPRQVPAVGISNRESPEEEAREREEFPPVDQSSPPPEDAGGSVGERGSSREGRQTSHKAGSRSVAQKEAGSKYADRSMPASRKVPGAFGREPHKNGTSGS